MHPEVRRTIEFAVCRDRTRRRQIAQLLFEALAEGGQGYTGVYPTSTTSSRPVRLFATQVKATEGYTIICLFLAGRVGDAGWMQSTHYEWKAMGPRTFRCCM